MTTRKVLRDRIYMTSNLIFRAREYSARRRQKTSAKKFCTTDEKWAYIVYGKTFKGKTFTVAS